MSKEGGKQDELLKKPGDASVAVAAELDLLEEDDEFEEFPQETWEQPEDMDANTELWEDNWDDDDPDEDFLLHLRTELAKSQPGSVTSDVKG